MGHVRVLVQASGELSSAERNDRSEVSLTTKSSCSTISGLPIESDGSQTPKALATFFNKKKALLTSSSLTKLLDKLRSGELKNTDELRNKFRATVSELGIVADQDIEPAVSQIISALRMAANGISGIDKVSVEQDVATMQRVFSEARDLLHDTREFGDLIAKDALRSLGDPSEQARMWARFAEGLDSNSTFFEARGRNPQFLAGEEALQMEYGDPHQFYVLAPWHMLALRWGESPGTTFGVENLVPAIDVVGYRYQWARSRFADLRFGLGGVFIKDRLSVPDPTQPGQRFDKDFYNFAAQFNMGLGGFKLGLGYLLSNNGEAALPWDATRIRILVGADLVKLFSGRNAEAL